MKPITHAELCIATAKRFIKKVALYEYKSLASAEEPDVLIFEDGYTELYEIKTSIADFRRDHKKDARKKYKTQYWAQYIPLKEPDKNGVNKYSTLLKLDKGHIEIFYIEKEHLGNRRFYVCPWGVIPVESVPEGWGLYYYKNGKFYNKKPSSRFRSNLAKENDLAIHALRRYASGDSKGIMVNTYKMNKSIEGAL